MPMVAKLDELGKPAWIALTILGFMVWWPIGLADLGLHRRERTNVLLEKVVAPGPLARTRRTRCGTPERGGGPSRSSGNRAFDEYRQDTLQRLEEEQREFHDFLARLRMAKDKAEFDQFMAERRSRTGRQNAGPSPQN